MPEDYALKEHAHSGASDSGVKVKVSNLEIDSSIFLQADGTVPLTANWAAGSFKITASQFASTVAIGTAPLVVTSTTVVTNLNADMVDGLHSTDFFTPTITSVATNDMLQYSGTAWVNRGTQANPLKADGSTTASGINYKGTDTATIHYPFVFRGGNTTTPADRDMQAFLYNEVYTGTTEGQVVAELYGWNSVLNKIGFWGVQVASGTAGAGYAGNAATYGYLGVVGKNVHIGELPDTAVAGTSAAGVLYIHNGTIPTTQPADRVALLGEDLQGSATNCGLTVITEAGNYFSFGKTATLNQGLFQYNATGGEMLVQFRTGTNVDGILGVMGRGTGVGTLKLYNGTEAGNYVGFKASASLAANKVWVLPTADGSANQALKTDGSGNLGWVSVASASFTLAVQMNAGVDSGWMSTGNLGDLSNTGFTAGNLEYVWSVGTATLTSEAKINLSKNFSFQTVIQLLALGVGAAEFAGISDGSTAPTTGGVLTVDHAGFIFAGSKVWISNANGTTQTKTDVTASVTATNYNVYRIERSGSTISFSVNGTSVGSSTTNLPIGTTRKLFWEFTNATAPNIKRAFSYVEAN